MMNYSKSITDLDGNEIKREGGAIKNDRVRDLLGDEKAQVEVLVGTTLGFGEAKVHVAVRLTCNQDEATVFEAGEIAYRTAKEIARSSLDDLAPPLPNIAASPPPAGTPR